MTQEHQCNHQHHPLTSLLLQIRAPPLGTAVTLATRRPPCFLQPGRQGGLRKRQKRFVPGCCIPCGGANLQQGPTTVKHDTGAPVQSPASSPHTTPTPNQDDPSRHYTDVGNTLATVFPPQPRHKVGWEKLRNGLYPVAASPVVVQTCSRDPLQSNMTQEHQCKHQHHPPTPLLLPVSYTHLTLPTILLV